jgi:hypothetical protein
MNVSLKGMESADYEYFYQISIPACPGMINEKAGYL